MRSIAGALAVGGATLAVAIGFRVANAYGVAIDHEVRTRVVSAMFGLIVAWSGNMVPKTLTPLARLRCDPARYQARQRRAGWAFVLAGLGWSVSWLILPMPIALPVAMLLLMFGTVAGVVPLTPVRR
jgi:hypothetical protein